MAIVSIDDEATWPSPIANVVQEWANDLAGTTEYCSDLALPLEAEKTFRRLFDGHRLKAYHATKLLPHEVALVQAQGLKALTADLVASKVVSAVEAGEITPHVKQLIDSQNVFHVGEARYRENQVCLFLSDYYLRHDVGAIELLLDHWGGEAIFKLASQELRSVLREIGRPTIVTALLDVSNMDVPHRFSPCLHQAFVGAALGLDNASADVFYRSNIPAADIVSVAMPGHEWYHQYENLPV